VKYLKFFIQFKENATASASSTAGAGAVSSAQPGALPGTTGTEGSGDIGFTFKKEKRKKGDPTKVTDMRDLAPAKGVAKVEEIKESDVYIKMRPRDPAYDPVTRNMINDCLIELYDSDFELTMMDYDKQRLSVDLDDEETGYFSQEELRISLNKNINEYWTGNMIVNCKFDESGVISKDISTLRARGKELTESESELYVLVEEVAQKLLGNLDYEKGSFRISFEVAGSAMPYNTTRNTSVNVHFNLENNLKE
jgi:hypothetical protein